MKHRHVILEGKPTTGKTEVSNLFKIYFPARVVILPELCTVLVREHNLMIMRDRRKLADLLREAVPARAREVRELLDKPDILVFEESHMGVHWAYSKVVDDSYFLELYEKEIKDHIVIPDIFLRLDIPIELSVKRQIARATADVEVSGELVRKMFDNLQEWHRQLGRDNLVVVDTNRAPDVVIREIMDVLGIEYEPLSAD